MAAPAATAVKARVAAAALIMLLIMLVLVLLLLSVEQAEPVEQAELAVSNTEALLEAGAAAEQDLTKAKQALTQAQAGVAQAEAQQSASLAQIQASMDQINKQASLGTVTAPCSGTVTAVNVDRGGMASSAQPSVVIAENSAVEVQVSVAEDVFTGIKVGDTASVTVSAVSKESMNGTVSTLPAAANAQTNLYDVSVSLPSGTKPPIGKSEAKRS